MTSVLLLFSKAISAYARLAKPNLMRTLFDYVGHPMYGASAIREILPGGAHFGRILVFGFKRDYPIMLPSHI